MPPFRGTNFSENSGARRRIAVNSRNPRSSVFLPVLTPDNFERTKGSLVTRRVGYAAGAFDLFHIGHLNILRRAKEQCDYLIAGVVSDEMLELARGRGPIIPLAERLEIVSHISFVDRAHAEVVPDKLETWRELKFDVFFKGDDWRGTARGLALEREFAAVGVEVVYFPYTMDTSSTALRAAIAALTAPMPDEVAS